MLARKSSKENYQQTLSDLERKGFSSNLLTIEIGLLGHWTLESLKSLFNMKAAPSLSKWIARAIMNEAAVKVVGASQIVFNARVERTWSSSCILLWSIRVCYMSLSLVLSVFSPCQEHTLSYRLCMYPWVLGSLSVSLLCLCLHYFKQHGFGSPL